MLQVLISRMSKASLILKSTNAGCSNWLMDWDSMGSHWPKTWDRNSCSLIEDWRHSGFLLVEGLRHHWFFLIYQRTSKKNQQLTRFTSFMRVFYLQSCISDMHIDSLFLISLPSNVPWPLIGCRCKTQNTVISWRVQTWWIVIGKSLEALQTQVDWRVVMSTALISEAP